MDYHIGTEEACGKITISEIGEEDLLIKIEGIDYALIRHIGIAELDKVKVREWVENTYYDCDYRSEMHVPSSMDGHEFRVDIGILGHSYCMGASLSDRMWSLEQSLLADIGDDKRIVNKPKSVSVDFEGSREKKNLELVFSFKMDDDSTRKLNYRSHVDDSALEISEEVLVAYYGDQGKEFVARYGHEFYQDVDISEREPTFFELLSQEYLLDCSPDTLNGGEYMDEDSKMIQDVLNDKRS